MKKLLCISLSVILLLSMACLPRASAAVNYSTAFEDAINLLRWHSPYWDIEDGDAFPVASIIHYTKQQLCRDEYGEAPITEGSSTYYARYAIPADVFEAAARDFFAVVDIQALRSYTSFFWDHANFIGIDNFQNYREDRGVYLFSNSGSVGDSSRYEVLGYTQEGDRYKVYSRFLTLMFGQPSGVEGKDYVYIGTDCYAISHHLETVMAISNGRVQFHTWDEISQLPDVELTTPLTVLAQNETVTVAAAAGVFPADVVIEISTPDEDALQTVSEALSDLAADFLAYEISATAQPDGTAQVAFAIPQGFDPNKLALFHISEDGTAQRLDAVVNSDNGTIIAELPHFSLYAVVELAKADPLRGDVNSDGAVNARDARAILRYVADLITEADLDLTVADFNEDGKVNVRDARAILQHAAGLD